MPVPTRAENASFKNPSMHGRAVQPGIDPATRLIRIIRIARLSRVVKIIRGICFFRAFRVIKVIGSVGLLYFWCISWHFWVGWIISTQDPHVLQTVLLVILTSLHARYKLTNRVIGGCGYDLFPLSLDEQTRCILSRVSIRISTCS